MLASLDPRVCRLSLHSVNNSIVAQQVFKKQGNFKPMFIGV